MVNKQTTGSLERPNEKNGVKDGTIRSNFDYRRVAHATTATVANNRLIMIFTLDFFPINYDSSIATPTVHHSVFDSTTNIDNSVTIISID